VRVALGHVEILARDVAASERFYVGGLGFEVTERQGPSAVWLRAGPASLLLRAGEPGPRASAYATSGTALVVYTDDLPGTLARLARAGVAPCGTDGGPECPLVRDPDGNWLQVVDPRTHGADG
jgi:catechol 2,3-dioxygenase-like lactoylglutathione lyase family enzyme